MIMKTPFVVGKIVSDELFCNRYEELARLESDLLGSQSVALYSPRRLGKSSLIKVLLDRLDQQKVICVYLNLMGISSLEELVTSLARATTSAMVESLGGLSRAFRQATRLFRRVGIQFGLDPVTGAPVYSFTLRPDEPEGDLEDILAGLNSFVSRRRKQAVVALDEFQEVLFLPGLEGRAEALFRRIAESLPRTAFIFSGSKHRLLRAMFSESGRPFFRAAKLYELGPLPQKDCRDFLEKRFRAAKAPISQAILEKLARASEGHPYILQLLGSVAYGLLKERPPTDEEVFFREVLNEAVTQLTPEYELVWDTLARQPRARQILKLLAHKGPVKRFPGSLLRPYNLAPSTVSVALRNLEDLGLVWPPDKGGWCLVDPMFAVWLRSH